MLLRADRATGVADERRPVRPALSVEGLTLDYGTRRALDGVSFVIARGTILCLLGPSGSGKSSVLRAIAGLERPTAGAIALDGEPVAGPGIFVEPERRQVGMVFQDFALFPHLTVSENIAFGIRRRPRAEIDETIGELLANVGLADRAGSYPHMLSGGERQRVALARALAPGPRILLMDEPFSSLDSRLRDRVRLQTIALLKRTGTTTVLVTHDPSEALRVADQVGVLVSGRLEQLGTSVEIYRRPSSLRMARALGAVNAIEGVVERGELRTPLGDFRAPPATEPGPVIVCIRPQHVDLDATGSGVPARVTAVTYVGDVTEIQVRVDGVHLIARVSDGTSVSVGDDRRVRVDPSHFFLFPRRDAVETALVHG